MSTRRINLTFHGIGQPPPHVGPEEAAVWTSADLFRAVLDRVGRRDDALITFDDGNASDYDIAFPALRDRGLTGVFFVVAGRVGEPGFLDAQQVREMHAAGMTIGSHGMRHVSWRGLSDPEADAELVGACRQLADIIGQPVDQAACPFGAYDRSLKRHLRSTNLSRVFTSDAYPASPSDRVQPRYTVKADDSADSVERLFDDLRSPATSLRGRLRSTVKWLR